MVCEEYGNKSCAERKRSIHSVIDYKPDESGLRAETISPSTEDELKWKDQSDNWLISLQHMSNIYLVSAFKFCFSLLFMTKTSWQTHRR